MRLIGSWILDDHHVGEVVLVVRAVGRIEAGHEREIGRGFLHPDALALNFLRQQRKRGLDLILTWTCAMSGSVPCSKVKVIVTAPDEEDCDEK